MKNIINTKLKEEGIIYIEEIFKQVSPFLSEFQLWQLEQSAILDVDKKILCRRLVNKNNILEGYKIVIETNEEEYTLIILKDSIELIKNYCFNNSSVKELNKIEIENDSIKKTCKYQENKKQLEYTEKEESYLSFEEIIENLKQSISNIKTYQRGKK